MHEYRRFQTLYDNINAQIRQYRLDHVQLVNSIYEQNIDVFGNDIQFIRYISRLFNDRLNNRVNLIGNNECLQGVAADHAASANSASSVIGYCSVFANYTLNNLLTSTFYPFLDEELRFAADILVAVPEMISNANVLTNENRIIEFLDLGFRSRDIAWVVTAAQRFEWESDRFRTEGHFLVEEMIECMYQAILTFFEQSTTQEIRVDNC